MPESATAPTTAPPEPENTAAVRNRAETSDTMPEDLTVPAESPDTPEPDRQPSDADIREPEQTPATDDKTEAPELDNESEAPSTDDEAKDTEPDNESEVPPTDDEPEAPVPDNEATMPATDDDTEDPESDDDETQGYDETPDAEDDVPQEPTAPAGQVTKIVIWVRKGLASVGVQETGTDPEFATIASHDLDEIITAVPGIVRAAQEKWLTEPHRKPAAPAPATRPRPASSTRRAANSQNAPQTATPQLF